MEFLLAVRGIISKLSSEDELTRPSAARLDSIIAGLLFSEELLEAA